MEFNNKTPIDCKSEEAGGQVPGEKIKKEFNTNIKFTLNRDNPVYESVTMKEIIDHGKEWKRKWED